MSKTARAVLALYAMLVVAACAPKADEVVYVDQPAISVEPTYTGKYK